MTLMIGYQKSCLCFLLAWALSTSAQTAPPQARIIAPALHLGTEHGGVVVHDRSLPLLLRVRLSNPAGSNLAQQRAVASLNSKKPAAPSPTPDAREVITFGPSAQPLSRLLSFRAKDAKGAEMILSVRALRGTEFPSGTFSLDGAATADFRYGIDAAELAKLEPGVYAVVAILSQPDPAAGGWQGQIESAPLRVELRTGSLSKEQQRVVLLQTGRFYLEDRDYPAMEKQAAALLALDPKSVSAWELRGDAAVVQAKWDEAERSFQEAIKNAEGRTQAHIPASLREPPEYLYERLEQVRRMRAAAAP